MAYSLQAGCGVGLSHNKFLERIVLEVQERSDYGFFEAAPGVKNYGKQKDLPIFKQISWLREHYGLDVFRAIVLAASSTMERDKLPNLNWVKTSMIASGDKPKNIELTLKDFRWLEEDFLREAFEKEFGYQLSFLKGTGDLHNDNLETLFAKLVARIERENQNALSPLKELVQTLK